MMELTDKTQLIEYLKQNGLYAKHSLGQNFLVDKEALDKIIGAADLSKDDLVIEVGPGLGTLTTELVKYSDKVIAVELDDRLAGLLEKSLCHPELVSGSVCAAAVRGDGIPDQVRDDKLVVVNSDILKVNIPELVKDQKYKVIANIPYYITSKIIRLFLEQENKPECIVVLVQKEVAERICAKPGDMSVLALSVQVYAEPEIVSIVPANSFFPAPEVDSAILRITIYNDQQSIFNQYSNFNFQNRHEFEKDFFRLVNIGFASKRKTLVNNLSAGYHIDKKTAADIIKSTGLNDNIRAQELSVDDWSRLLGALIS